MRLVRLRADPAKVRVSVRHLSDHPDHQWLARVSSRHDTGTNLKGIIAYGATANEAVERALYSAAKFVEGIDLTMSWTYPHPQSA